MSAATSAARLRGVRFPSLPRSVWAIQGGMLVNAVGTGIVMPFLIIYLRDVRHFPLATAGLVSGTFALAGLAATFAAGPAVDRLGDRAVFVFSLLLLTAGYALLAFVTVPWEAFACTALAGAGNGGAWPAQSVLLLRLVPPEQRHVVFSLNRTTGNLGVGAGALLGGALVADGAAARFELLFLLDGASFALFALCALAAVRGGAGSGRAPAAGSYRPVLRDRTYVRVLAANALFVFCGFAPLEAAIPYFAKHEAHVGTLMISAVFLANTLGVVALQLPVAQALEGARRTRALAAAGIVWAAALAAVPLTAATGRGAVTAAILVAAAVTIALAESLHGATLTPLAADLAPPELRGRYMALVTSSWAVGFAVGPALAGLLLALSPFAVWPVACAGCLAAGAVAARLEARLPAAALRTPRHSKG